MSRTTVYDKSRCTGNKTGPNISRLRVQRLLNQQTARIDLRLYAYKNLGLVCVISKVISVIHAKGHEEALPLNPEG